MFSCLCPCKIIIWNCVSDNSQFLIFVGTATEGIFCSLCGLMFSWYLIVLKLLNYCLTLKEVVSFSSPWWVAWRFKDLYQSALIGKTSLSNFLQIHLHDSSFYSWDKSKIVCLLSISFSQSSLSESHIRPGAEIFSVIFPRAVPYRVQDCIPSLNCTESGWSLKSLCCLRRFVCHCWIAYTLHAICGIALYLWKLTWTTLGACV